MKCFQKGKIKQCEIFVSFYHFKDPTNTMNCKNVSCNAYDIPPLNSEQTFTKWIFLVFVAATTTTAVVVTEENLQHSKWYFILIVLYCEHVCVFFFLNLLISKICNLTFDTLVCPFPLILLFLVILAFKIQNCLLKNEKSGKKSIQTKINERQLHDRWREIMKISTLPNF